MRYAFFPGCSLESTAWDYDLSTRATCGNLGIELTELPDWVCCGSTPAHSSNSSLAVALPVLNLHKAKDAGFSEVLTACASCYARLRTANHKVLNDPGERERAGRICEKNYAGEVKVRHILDVMLGLNGPDRRPPTVTGRRRNRMILKRRVLAEWWNEPGEPEERRMTLHIAPELARKLSDDMILETDIEAVIAFCERTGRKVCDPATGNFSGHLQIGPMTFWAEYRPAAGGGFELVNAYGHRMSIEEV